MLFSHSFCFNIVNFMHSDWSITQNVNKRADWPTLFALVCANRFSQFKSLSNRELVHWCREYSNLNIYVASKNLAVHERSDNAMICLWIYNYFMVSMFGCSRAFLNSRNFPACLDQAIQTRRARPLSDCFIR